MFEKIVDRLISKRLDRGFVIKSAPEEEEVMKNVTAMPQRDEVDPEIVVHEVDSARFTKDVLIFGTGMIVGTVVGYYAIRSALVAHAKAFL